MRKAVIDVGSNSVLLVVEERIDDIWQPVYESSEVSSLGVGTKETGLLSEEGMSYTLDALRRAYAKAEELGVDETVAAATMAARIAKNTHEFLHRAVQQRTPVFVLSGDDEADLGFQAVANDPIFDKHPRLSIVDVGGQSTELVTADRSQGWVTRYRKSYAIGTLALRGSTLSDEANGPEEVLTASSQIDQILGETYYLDNAGHTIVLGATGTNLITIREKMVEWDPAKVHGQWLEFGEISRAVGYMMPMTDSERGAITGMEKGREKTLHIGSLILERFLFAIKAGGCSVSTRGWRHALLEYGMPKHSRVSDK